VERTIVDIGTLDTVVGAELDKVESAKDFAVALWRRARDESGANWNAYITRLRSSGYGSPKTTWWRVVPSLRAAFSLKEE
jgi:hypothetical protein